MRTTCLLIVTLMLASCTTSVKQISTPIQAENGVIELLEPNISLQGEVMTALKERCSVREFDEKTLDLETLSNLLWAANGINRAEEGKRTAPSAVNAQDILIYVCMPEGAYLYHPETNQLQLVCSQDLREDVAGAQEFAKKAPLALVLVSDLSRFPFDDEAVTMKLGSIDAGYVSQNIYLYCTIDHLVTVARGTMNAENLAKALMLNENQIPILNHPVGYPKQENK